MGVRSVQEKLSFLCEKEAGKMKHSGSDLLSHLTGTYSLLQSWGAREAVCDAGLFHSIYGTESYQTATVPLGLRSSVQEIIGTESEELAYLFGVKNAKTFYPLVFREVERIAPEDNSYSPKIEETYMLQHRLTREWLPFSFKQMVDLVNIVIANAIEQRPRVPEHYWGEDRDLYMKISLLALPGARKMVESK